MIDKVELKKAIGNILIKAGFSRKSGSWYKSGADAIVVINLQKSDFGNYFYLNIGICLKELLGEPFPKVGACHISMRADSLINSDCQNFDIGLNTEEGTLSDFSKSLSLLEEKLIPLTSEFFSIDLLRGHYAMGDFKRALIFWQAREILEKV